MWALRHLPWISRSALRVAKPRLFSSAPSVASDLSMNSIVKVFATIAPPNYALPWQNHPLKNVTGSGFIISGQRILTNAHVVADQAFVMVRKHGSPERFAARVLAAGHDCDLALLAVEDPSFFDSTLPVQFGGLPRLEDEVSVVGYPTGGDNISVTRGIVSRVEPQQYAHGTTTLLAIQIDAAINPGNSGGPAFQGSKVVGVAFQNLQGAENIGFVIPTTIIDHFLTDVERNASKNRPHAGFSSLGLHCQAMENINLRLFKKMKQGQTGVLVSKVNKVSSAHGVIEPGDVVLSIDGVNVACDGSVTFRERERIPFDWLLATKQVGEQFNHYDRQASYFIFAGLVFIKLTQPFLHEWGQDWYSEAPRKLSDRAMNGEMEDPRQEVVVLSSVLADEINIGYADCVNTVLTSVNGVKILNLEHARSLAEAITDGPIRFELEDKRLLVVDAAAARASQTRLMERHRIPRAHSTTSPAASLPPSCRSEIPLITPAPVVSQ